MRALFFLNSFFGGGAERVCLNLAKQLGSSGIESDFVTIYDSAGDYEIPDSVHICSLGIRDRHLACAGIVRHVPKVNRFLTGKPYVLVTAHLQPSILLASLTKVGKRCLYVMHVTGQLRTAGQSGIYKAWFRRFFREKKLVAVSDGLKEELMVRYGIRPECITTIYNPCQANASESVRTVEIPHIRPYILVMGRVTEQKNPLLALTLYREGGFYKDYDLIYLGKGPLEGRLREQIARCHLEDHVFLKGFRKNPELWLKNASLLLSCSRYEGLPMNLIEALICGTPVVASDCPYGPDEILTGELAKYLISPEEKPKESIAVIASALKSYPEITEDYYRKFDPERIAQTYLEVWKSCFGEGKECRKE